MSQIWPILSVRLNVALIIERMFNHCNEQQIQNLKACQRLLLKVLLTEIQFTDEIQIEVVSSIQWWVVL